MFISHDLKLVKTLCHEIIIMKKVYLADGNFLDMIGEENIICMIQNLVGIISLFGCSTAGISLGC